MKFTDTLKELEAKATDGPWIREGFSRITGVTMNGILRSEDAELIAFLRNHAQEIIKLAVAAEMAKLHVEELREGWCRGDIEADSGVRSNRNVYVETKLREALAALNKE